MSQKDILHDYFIFFELFKIKDINAALEQLEANDRQFTEFCSKLGKEKLQELFKTVFEKLKECDNIGFVDTLSSDNLEANNNSFFNTIKDKINNGTFCYFNKSLYLLLSSQ